MQRSILPRSVAALFVAKNGSYINLDGVDPWPEDRDARLYRGPYPVVAHPPCQRWGKFWAGQPLHIKRTGERKIKGDDGGCFARALESVRWRSWWRQGQCTEDQHTNSVSRSIALDSTYSAPSACRGRRMTDQISTGAPPMTDTLVGRLRDPRFIGQEGMREEAAAEIERLTRERDHLHTLLNDAELQVTETIQRALAAESSLSEAVKALQYGLDAVRESFDYAHSADDHLLAESRYRAIEDALSAIRARGAVLGSDKV